MPTPAADEVLIAVEACGVCGADLNDIERPRAATVPGRVPGHEVVGRIVKRGERVPAGWQVGQRVGVGRLGGPCNECNQCRQGRFATCSNQEFVGATRDGGYAEMMLARSSGLVAIPSERTSADAAPILCAGVATFNGLKRSGAEPGDLVAVLGVGGLGHMAIQYARKMGFEVAAVGRGHDKAELVADLGAHHYIDTSQHDAASFLSERGGAQAIIATTGDASAVSAVLAGLAPEGRLVQLGTGKEPLELQQGALVAGQRRVLGSITGTTYDTERALAFSVLTDVRPMIEKFPLDDVVEAYSRLRSGAARFRLVLTMQ